MLLERRLAALAVVHFMFGTAAAFLARVDLGPGVLLNHLPVVPYVALNVCQAFLIALWAAFSKVSPWLRLIGMAAGSVYLEFFVPTPELLGVSSLTLVVTTICLLAVKALGLRIEPQLEAEGLGQGEKEGMRVSIGGLMIFTAAVAVLCTAARALQASPQGVLLLSMIWALCFVAVGLTSLWAALGNARPVRRAALVFVLSPMLGVFFAFAANAHKAGWVYIVLTMMLYPTALLGSLWVVRSDGYRFLGRVATQSISIEEPTRGS